MLNKFTTGMLAGGIVTAVGLSWMVSDVKTRKRMARDSKRAMRKAGNFFNGVTDMFE